MRKITAGMRRRRKIVAAYVLTAGNRGREIPA